MHRLHFTEIQDQAWFPGFLRDAVTDTLQYAFNTAGLYMPVLPQLQKVLRISGARNVLDLCSGGGGPWLRLQRALEENHSLQVEVRLSDKYPNLSALHHLHAMTGKRLTFHNDPVGAKAVEPEWSGFRTMFSCFHHFRPHDARANSTKRGRESRRDRRV